MPASIHVNGPALIAVGAQGLQGQLAQLGISEDGVTIQLNNYDDPVMTDAGGMRVPVDLQEMGQDAIIRMRLVAYDLAILQRIRKRANAAAEGVGPSVGRLIASNNHGFRVAISSETDEPWRFFLCYPRSAQQVKVGTRRSMWDVEFYSWPLVNNLSTSFGARLYDHVFA
ncbi:hypothetical protein [Tuwongella immobilis]|uniref:Uncharacterized protein n=1 Tax=Tuwongella immobilis TaxID=692036 RepID=A0A6C2YVY0_9BACT|nr:hypothetical protein [Tuwongella immobilis]VIP02173.1 unnamed protein product [Tuwongella immobilis]VIP05604.1 unnamed protein product [Tuwongella immobilis]VTS00606.1 unnamed protein product [Tuwongella immobilis]VTS08563.1 unnamed protein product [Tuwongella immobilis]